VRILIFSNPYAPEPTGVGPYSHGLAAHLVAAGHEVAVIAANPSYPKWELFEGFGAWRWSRVIEDGVRVHRVPVYIPRRTTGARRMLHYASYVGGATFPALRLAFGFRPDVVLTVAPTLLVAPLALFTAKLARARTWLHVQDFEVGAALATGAFAGDGVVARLASGFERLCLRAFDRCSSISPRMCDKLAEEGVDPARIYELRNWADLEGVRPLAASTYRALWGIGERRVALYSGSIGKKQGIEIIPAAARLLAHRRDLLFVICGNGPGAKTLAAAVAGADNVRLENVQPFDRLGDLLALADVHLLPQVTGAADLVLPSKLTNILASGRPVVAAAAPGTSLAQEVEGCGLATPPEDVEAFAAAIERLLDDHSLHAATARSARLRAEKVWDKERILTAFEAQLGRLVDGEPARQ
jgi:colanic acid biosynthesis glycosyl transferase WcaI